MIDRKREIEIESNIVEILEDYNYVSFPLSMSRLAGLLGISLSEYPVNSRINLLSNSYSSDAFVVHDSRYTYTRIYLAHYEESQIRRVRFSVAHEIGHTVLEHHEDSALCEEEANYFAGYLLAPHPLVLRCPHDYTISEIFGVSGWCANYALLQAKKRVTPQHYSFYEKWLVNHAFWHKQVRLAI